MNLLVYILSMATIIHQATAITYLCMSWELLSYIRKWPQCIYVYKKNGFWKP